MHLSFQPGEPFWRGSVDFPNQPLGANAYAPAAELSLGQKLALAAFAGLAIWSVLDYFESDQAPARRCCSVCGSAGHDRRTCPHDGPRRQFGKSIPKGVRCECCGRPGYTIERHHTRGRSSLEDFLDMCGACHIECGHGGDFRNLARKPWVCRVHNRVSRWRTVRS